MPAPMRTLRPEPTATPGAGSVERIALDMRSSGAAAWTIATAAWVALLLALPLARVLYDGLTLTGIQEESSGYRYFFTLRILYGVDDRPWLPQAQLVGLVHELIQIALTRLGYPPTQLFPRIDLFVYAAVAAPVAATALASAWAAAPIQRGVIRLVIGTAATVAAFEYRSWGFDILLKPDYTLWAAVVALVGLGSLLRLLRRGTGSIVSRAAWLGVFGGVCVGIKPTYAVFALAVLLFATVRTRSFRGRAMLIAASAAIAATVLFVVTLAYYLGSLSATIRSFEQTVAFMAGVRSAEPFGAWVVSTVVNAPLSPSPAVILLPLMLAAGAIVCRVEPRWMCLSLLPGSVLVTYFLYSRFVPATMFEANQYLLLAVLAFVASVNGWTEVELVSASTRRMQTASSLVVALSLAVLTLWLVYWSFQRGYPRVLTTNWAAQASQDALARNPGMTLFLIPSNDVRPITIDSAIYKGGTTISSPMWADASPLVRAMFPDRWYLGHSTRDPHTPVAPANLVFVYNGTADGTGKNLAMDRLLSVFGVSTAGYDCDTEIEGLGQVIVVCARRA